MNAELYLTAQIATDQAVLVEASAAGDVRAVPAAVLCGVGLGLLYDLFCLLAYLLGVRAFDAFLPKESRIRHVADALLAYRARSPVTTRPLEPRVRHTHGRAAFVMQAVMDVLYCLLCGIVGAVFLYRFCYGVIRWYAFAGIAVGWLAFRKLPVRPFVALGALSAALLYASLIFLYNTVCYLPLFVLYRVCRRIWRIAVFFMCLPGRGIRQIYRKHKHKAEQKQMAGKGKNHGKNKETTEKEGQLLHKDRVFRLFRILRHHAHPSERTDRGLQRANRAGR